MTDINEEALRYLHECLSASQTTSTHVPVIPLIGNAKLQSLEQYLEKPVRTRRSVSVRRIEDLGEYMMTEEAGANSAVFISPEKFEALGIIDYGFHESPDWSQHKIELSMIETPEYLAVQELDDGTLNQRQMIEWTQDWQHTLQIFDINDDPMTIPAFLDWLRQVETKKTSRNTNEENDFQAKLSSVEEMEIRHQGQNTPARIVVTGAPLVGLDDYEMVIRIRGADGGDKPVFKTRLVGGEYLRMRIMDDVRERITAVLDGDVRVYVGSSRSAS